MKNSDQPPFILVCGDAKEAQYYARALSSKGKYWTVPVSAHPRGFKHLKISGYALTAHAIFRRETDPSVGAALIAALDVDALSSSSDDDFFLYLAEGWMIL